MDTIEMAVRIAKLLGDGESDSSVPRGITARNLGKYVVVRTYSAGVHVGVLRSHAGREVELDEARRIWSWCGANTLHEIALRGVGDGSRVSEPVASITLTEAIEIIPTTREAESNLRASTWQR